MKTNNKLSENKLRNNLIYNNTKKNKILKQESKNTFRLKTIFKKINERNERRHKWKDICLHG